MIDVFIDIEENYGFEIICKSVAYLWRILVSKEGIINRHPSKKW